ncbi:MAG: YicC family protein, partial [Spirochaetales bacterium]
KKILRGKINLNLVYEGTVSTGGRVMIDRGCAKSYYNELRALGKSLGLKDDVTLKDVMLLPGVASYEPAAEHLSEIWPKIKVALDKALAMLVVNRNKEGKAIYLDLKKRSQKISKLLAVVKSRAHLNIGEYKKKFTDRVKDMTGGRQIDMGRLEMEVAIYAKNSDISEEITRLENHLDHFNQTISGSGEVGKKIDFIAQELHREVNTIGSKASDFKIAKSVIDMKGEIEKIREQAKNLE